MCEDDKRPASCDAGGEIANELDVVFAEAVGLCEFDEELADTLSRQLGVARQPGNAFPSDTDGADRSMAALRMLVDAAMTACDSYLSSILAGIKLVVVHVDVSSRSNITLH